MPPCIIKLASQPGVNHTERPDLDSLLSESMNATNIQGNINSPANVCEFPLPTNAAASYIHNIFNSKVPGSFTYFSNKTIPQLRVMFSLTSISCIKMDRAGNQTEDQRTVLEDRVSRVHLQHRLLVTLSASPPFRSFSRAFLCAYCACADVTNSITP